MNLNLTATLILFGLFQSTIMIFLIIRNRNWKQTPNILLIGLLVVVGLSLVPTFLGKSGLLEKNDYLRFLPFNLVIFIFPLLYLYLKSLLSFSFRFDSKSFLHLILPLVFTVYYVLIWIGSLTISPEMKGVWILRYGYFEIQLLHNIALLLLLFTYTIMSYLEVRNYEAINISKVADTYRTWILTLLGLFFIGVLFELITTLLGKIYGYWKSSPVDEWLGFSLTMIVKIYNGIVLYIISLVGYLSYSNPKLKKQTVSRTLVEEQIKSVLHIMKDKKPFLSKDFSLSTFAELMEITPSVLSNLLNSYLDTSFNDFTNKYRIEEVKDKLRKGLHKSLTLEYIAEDSGFKSKTTFYRAFSKFSSQTPKEYIKQLEKEKKVS
ncbi:helix-turn-helix domain-containing protein [Aquimarina sp. BL5]|nr:helix-turn-helix domain-containing protein [Aquimarina sp. BL5]